MQNILSVTSLMHCGGWFLIVQMCTEDIFGKKMKNQLFYAVILSKFVRKNFREDLVF
jgi:hypothetical protein